VKMPVLRVRRFLAGLLLVACTHHDGTPDLERLKNDPGALDRARAAASQRCQPGSPSDDCCSALMQEGDTLWARSDQEAAWQAYQRTRARCPVYAPVRRHMFLMKHPLSARTNRKELELGVHVVMSPRLKDDLRLAYYDLYLDGEPALERPVKTTVGTHEATLEVYLAPRTQGPAPARLDETLIIDVPAALADETEPNAHITVTVTDRTGDTIPQRVAVEMKAGFTSRTRFLESLPTGRPTTAPAPNPAAPADGDTMKFLPPTLGLKQLLTPRDQWLPAELQQKAGGSWGLFKICVNKAGAVDEVSVLRSPARTVEGDFVSAIRTWTFQPYVIGGAPVSFCYPMRLAVSPR